MTGERLAAEQKLPDQTARRVKSTFLVAVVIFGAINFYFSFFTPIQFDQYRAACHSWAWWAMKDLRTSGELHNVALLGSSLMVSAMAGTDANYTNKSLDLTQYHKAVYLDHKLRTAFGGNFNTFNLALPGQMPSDAYLALKSMVNCAHRPDVVIYGVAPRDFLDSMLSSPVDTDPFHYFKRLVNVDDVVNYLFRSPFAKLDWFLQRLVYFYGMSIDFQLATVDQASNFLAVVLPPPAGAKPFTWWDRTKLLPSYLPTELAPNAVMTQPVDQEAAIKNYKDNTPEYLARYKSPDELTYKTQIFFLKKMAEFCRKERIELVIVNMPITFQNAMVLQPQIFNNYRQAMQVICSSEKLTYIDLCDFGLFKITDFTDTVHMNAFGGKKFVDRLVELLAMYQKTSSAMAMAGKELERYLATMGRERDRTY
jgi:hypothetical protein